MVDVCLYLIADDAEQAPHLQRFREGLDNTEQAVLAEMKHPGRCRQYLIGHGFIRQQLASLLGRAPRDLELSYASDHRSMVQAHPEIFFSLSHCDGYVACALADFPIGVDIDVIKKLEFEEVLVKKYGHPDELKLYASLPETERALAYFKGWTLKEALFKTGFPSLSELGRETACFFDKEGRIQLRFHRLAEPPALAQSPGNWQFHQNKVGEHVIYTVATKSPQPVSVIEKHLKASRLV